jgi:hypothetical protein
LRAGALSGAKTGETPVRIFILITLAAICASTTARAQAWDSRYPVCQVVYGPTAQYNDCRFSSLEQCRALATGLPVQCVENPYFAGADGPKPRRHRR